MAQESNPPLTDLTSALVESVARASNVLIGTHLNPDGDAMGSALAVSHWLDSQGVRNQVLCNNDAPGYLQFLPGAERVRQVPDGEAFDLGFILDLESLDRLGSCRPYFEGLPHTVVIDHHEPFEMPGDLRIVSTQAPATASILCDVFGYPGDDERFPVGVEIATCLLTGLVTDTGGFRYPNASARSLHQAAWLMERGASLFQVSDECYLNRDEPAVHLLARALSNIKFDCEGRIAWVILPAKWYAELGALEEHTEGIVNEVLSIRTVRAAFVLRQGKFGKAKGSLRSKGSLDVAAVAQSIGGGGHKNAAGVTIEGTLEEAEAIVSQALKVALGC